MTKLSELCNIQYGYAFDSNNFTEDDNFLPLVRIRDVKRGFSETYYNGEFPKEYIIRKGDILIGMDGEFNIARWKSQDALLNQRVCKIQAKEGVDEDYLRLYLSKELKKIESRTPFVTVKHLSAKELNKIDLHVPEYEEQRKISMIFGVLENIIVQRQTELLEFDALIKARFVEMFGDNKANPMNWKQSTIGECCTLKSGTTLSTDVENEGGPIPYIKVGDMNYPGNERYITTSSRFVSEATAGKGLFKIGSIVFPKRGGAISTNKKRMTKKTICADLNVMGVSSNGSLLPEYLLTYFDFIDLGSLSDGSSVPQINNKNIAPLIVCIPPIELQNQFASFVAQVDKSKVAVQNALDEAQLLFDSLMQHYFG